MKRIYTFGDGYATGHIWPEWPQILAALCTDCEVINNSGVGAGPEYLVHRLVQSLPSMRDNIAIFQWPKPARFDKLIEDVEWHKIVDNDPVYHFNRYVHQTETWWLSSESKSDEVQQYHRTFIQQQQHNSRSNDYQVLVKNTLENINCEYLYTTQMDHNYFSMQEKYRNIRQNEIQPSPPIHFDWIIEFIIPNLPIEINSDRADCLKTLIYQQTWEAYHWDRDAIWGNLIASLNKQCA